MRQSPLMETLPCASGRGGWSHHDLHVWRSVLLLSVALPLFAACDEGEEPASAEPECDAGDTRACDGGANCRTAVEECGGIPRTWGPCECLEPEPPADAGPRPELGGGCEEDADCPQDAFCLGPDSTRFFGGAPPVGVCAAECTGQPAACDAFADAVCVTVEKAPERLDADAGVDDDAGAAASADPPALCFEGCALGTGADPKCHGLDHVGCELLSEGSSSDGFCRPLCTTDDDCSDRSCDRRSGACVESPAVPDPTFGRQCDPDGGALECDGLCVDLTDDYAVCSHRCVFGEPGDCTGAPSAPRGGCLFSSEGGSIADVGFCGELCDCPEQCSASGAVCDGFTDEELVRVFGRKGVCAPEALATGEPITCK